MNGPGTPPPIDPESGEAQNAQLWNYIALLLIHKWTIAAVTLLCVGGAVFYTFSITPIYRAWATLHIEPKSPKVLSEITEVAELGSRNEKREYYQTQYKILSSNSLLHDVLRRAQLDEDLEFLKIDLTKTDKTREEILAKIDAPGIFAGRVTVEPIKDSQLVTIAVSDWDANRATLLANMIGDVYIERNLTHRIETTKNAVAWLEVQMEDLKKELRDSEVALGKFKRDHGLLSVSLSDRQNLLAAELEGLSGALNRARIKRMELSAQVVTPEGADEDDLADKFSTPVVVKNTSVQRFLDRLAELRESLAEISTRYEPAHPNYRRVQARIEAVEKNLEERVNAILTSPRKERREVELLEAQLNTALASAKQRAMQLNSAELDYVRLQREYDTNRSLHDMVFSRLKETSLTGFLESNNVRFLDRAKVPGAPVVPNIPLNLTIAIIIGLAAGIAAAALRTFADDTIKSHQDIEQSLMIPYLGMIPTVPTEESLGHRLRKVMGTQRDRVGKNPDLYVYTHPGSQVAESCRAIRSNLIFMSPDKPLRRIAVTSAEAGAGKTSTAVKLAVLMANTQGKTLLVDADMRRGRVHEAFGAGNEAGLSTVMCGETSLEEATQKTEVPDVDILTCSRLPPNPAELLHSQTFTELVEEIDDRYGLAIYDTPPLLNVTDALILGNHVDGVVLVARAGKTRRGALRRVIEQLQDVQVRVFGVVLNDVDLSRRAYSYYYHYRSGGYYGRYAYSESDRPPPEQPEGPSH